MHLVRALARHPTAGPTLRYGISGATVAAVYLSLPVVLSGAVGLPIQFAIPIAYVLAVSLHFMLQRRFVFRHVEEFALSGRQQAARYVALGAVQYPTTALATALLPQVLGIPTQAAFVCTTLTISLVVFLVLRGHVFNPAYDQTPEARRAAHAAAKRGVGRSAAQDHDVEADLVRQAHPHPREDHRDLVQAQTQPDPHVG